MKVTLDLDQRSLARLREVLESRELRAKHLAPALDAVADDFLLVQRRRFASASAIWAPLSPEWAVQKAKQGRSTAPLVGGELERSLTRRGARFAVRRIGSNSVTLGTSDPVAGLHHGGTKRMPKRPPVSLGKADQRRWAQLFVEHLRDGKGRGL